MAFLSDTPPYQQQQLNIAGALQGPSITGLQAGTAGQLDLASLLRSLSPGTYGTGVSTATGAAGGLQDLSQLWSALGLGGVGQAQDWLQQAVQTETTGTLPQGAQDIVQENLQQRQAAIRGKYAQLGMSGSSDEFNELDQASRQSVQDQFTLSQSIGNLLGGQALQYGNLNTVLANLGMSGLGTAGNLGTTLATIGLSGLNLSGQDYTNLATEGFNSLGLEAGIYSDAAKQQMTADQNITNAIGNFFKMFSFNLGGGSGTGTTR